LLAHQLPEPVTEDITVVLTIVSALIALVYLAKFLRKTLRSFRHAAQRFDALANLVDRELKTNGGTSMKDTLNQVKTNTSRISNLEYKVGALQNRFDAQYGRIVPTEESHHKEETR
jgi:hypothetical protein